MPINRSRYIQRNFQAEGSEPSAALCHALAQIVDPVLAESILHHLSALDEFGGELYIGANRQPQSDGKHLTVGYLVGYNSKAQIKDAPDEDDVAYGTEAAPEYADLRDEMEAEVEEMQREEEVAA